LILLKRDKCHNKSIAYTQRKYYQKTLLKFRHSIHLQILLYTSVSHPSQPHSRFYNHYTTDLRLPLLPFAIVGGWWAVLFLCVFSSTMTKPNVRTHCQKRIFITFSKKRGGGDIWLAKLKFMGHRDGVLGNPQNRNWTGKTGTKWILHIRFKQLVCSVVVSSGFTVKTEFFLLENQARKMWYPFYCLHRLESTSLYCTLYVVQFFPSLSGGTPNWNVSGQPIGPLSLEDGTVRFSRNAC
jgi:hypothetical protein